MTTMKVNAALTTMALAYYLHGKSNEALRACARRLESRLRPRDRSLIRKGVLSKDDPYESVARIETVKNRVMEKIECQASATLSHGVPKKSLASCGAATIKSSSQPVT